MNVFLNFKLFAPILLFISVFCNASTIDPPIKSASFYEYDYDCDLCGCTTGSGSFGFGTLNNANFVGVRYINQHFESKNGIFSNSPVSEETFNTYQLWAQVPINNSIYFSANLPYQDLSRKMDGTNENINGIGDANIIGWFKLPFYKKPVDDVMEGMEKEHSGHSLQFGLGVKLPTGKFEEALVDRVNPGFQVGTGSVDGIFSLGHSFAGNTFGVNTLLSYYLKTENKNEYKFGNQFSYSTKFYTAFPIKKTMLMPFLGISGDVFNKIEQYGETINDTDGSILNSSIGTELVVNRCIFGVNYTLPISQNLFGGNVTSKNQLSLYFNFAL
ncbi:hypothetical protein LG651_14500 [Tamlana sp. 62-3]|uniref:Transporter n=1 Tax=Neotamlana sargassicola TaxID=2883125 RepID=A0A9X1L927_9FLAO|nr:hypothetical protein [Tamlana sargassicola]MCB4809463.1 hypothetical protein [Tamlana sargassicola]